MAWLIPYFAASLVGFAPDYRNRRLAYAIALACAAYPFIALVVLSFGKAYAPTTYDGTLRTIDGAWGLAIRTGAAHRLRDSLWLRVLTKWVYDWNLPLAMGAVWLRWQAKRDTVLPLALCTAALLGLIGYAIVPATGPGMAPDDFRNAMPSVHFATTLLCAAALWPTARWPGVAFVLVTGLATLGFGEHYVIDLLVAVPFAAAIWLGVQRQTRAMPYGLVTLAALLAIRWH